MYIEFKSRDDESWGLSPNCFGDLFSLQARQRKLDSGRLVEVS
jgi:hypothetical protein